MLTIRHPPDFDLIADPELREWLRSAHPFIEEAPECGWLLVLDDADDADDIRNLDTGIAAVRDLTAIATWEWAEYAGDTIDYYTAVVVLCDDGSGLAFAVPGALVRATQLETALKEVATCTLP